MTSTLPPTDVGRRCWIRTAVPTVVCPARTNCAAASTVAASIQAINRGVASTGTSPLPSAVAVSASVTSKRTAPTLLKSPRTSDGRRRSHQQSTTTTTTTSSSQMRVLRSPRRTKNLLRTRLLAHLARRRANAVRRFALLLSHRRHSGRQPWRLVDTAASGSHGESAAWATKRERAQLACLVAVGLVSGPVAHEDGSDLEQRPAHQTARQTHRD